MGSATTNRHGVTALDFATVSGCDQLVTGPTHARGGTLDLLMTDVPDLVRINLGLLMTAGVHSTSSRRLISGGRVIALELSGMSLSITRGGPMLYMPRLCVSLVSEAGMF